MEYQTVAIIGTGVIGASWATCFLARGLDVIATDPAPGAEERLRAQVAAQWPGVAEPRMLALVVVSTYVFVVSYAIFKLVDLITPMRVTAADEEEGLDRSQHGETIFASEASLGLAGGE
jgi:ammonia channel protein AmtB